MRVAVITPYYKESAEVLRQCHDSVVAQSHPCTHILVADGFPNPLVDTWEVEHFRLPAPHRDFGNAARCFGAMSAFLRGYEAVAFLDADNWYDENHIRNMVELQQKENAAVCTASRTLRRPDGSLLGNDPGEVDGFNFVDTNCMFFHRSAAHLIPIWGTMPQNVGAMGDRIVWAAVLAQRLPRAHSSEHTVHYRTLYENHYRIHDETPPPNAKKAEDVEADFQNVIGMSPREKARLLIGAEGLGGSLGQWTSLDNLVFPTKDTAVRGGTMQVSVAGRSVSLAMPDEPRIRETVRTVFAGDAYRPIPGLAAARTILDLGAGIGAPALFFRINHPQAKLYCTEPDSRTFRFLLRNLATIGGGQALNIGAHGVNSVGEMSLGSTSIFGTTYETQAVSGKLGLAYLADAAIVMKQVGGADIVRIDAEGAEVAILMRLLRWHEPIKAFYVEYRSRFDRDVIDAVLAPTHTLWYSTDDGQDKGVLCYVLRGLAPAAAA